ncbi:hypothetical protein DYBT9275_01955 [Dyadobacter sp. CECT 9275]|uniref:N-acetyltransferase domain-containing protein n=2 Tax=Dyadobacter helix TaxID=2822344 RepID=A0A916NBI3_9BACT|nr:hypothetical protein DYBT9275_01955 [Dyadobacter sp. CECT 9275]
MTWVDNPELLFQFAGLSWTFPLKRQDLVDYFEYSDRQSYMAIGEDGHPVGFGEIINDSNPSPRLGRLLIGPGTNRGKGLGVQLIKLLVAECEQVYNPDTVYLFVLENNMAALRCYFKSGFKVSRDGHIKIGGQPFSPTALLMSLTLKP